MAFTGIASIIITLYKYPGTAPRVVTVAELFSDVYASPVRGMPVILKGVLMEKAVPGSSGNPVIQDKTGFVPANYNKNGLPGMSFSGDTELAGKYAKITGWFTRGISGIVSVGSVEVHNGMARRFAKWSGLAAGSLMALAGILVLML